MNLVHHGSARAAPGSQPVSSHRIAQHPATTTLWDSEESFSCTSDQQLSIELEGSRLGSVQGFLWRQDCARLVAWSVPVNKNFVNSPSMEA